LIGFAIVAAVWQFIAVVVVDRTLLFASFTDTVLALYELVVSGEIYTHLAISAQAFFYGYCAAVLVGIPLGAALAYNRRLDRMFRNVVQAGYATPLVAVAPLIIVLFGIGLLSKVAVVFVLALFPIVIATQSALTSIDPSYPETARAFGASSVQNLRMVTFPAASLGVLTGLRLAVGRGIIGVVVGEFFGARAGLGYLLVQYSMGFQTAKTLAVVLLLAIIGVTANQGLLAFEKRVSPWKTEENRSGERR
jgi:NitT/TauT family transport system permease protein